MTNRRIEMFEYRQILLRMRNGESDRAIARDGLVSRVKAGLIRCLAEVKGWLNPQSALPDDQEIAKSIPKKGSGDKATLKVAPYVEQIQKWVEEEISATVIHQILTEQFGFTGSYNAVQRYVQKIKPKEPNATIPLNFTVGEAAQVDFGFGPTIIDSITNKPRKTWFFVMTLCWSRHQYVEIVRDQTVSTWLGCHRRAFEWFGGVPKKIIIDNAKCAITKACYHDPVVQRSYAEYAEGYGFMISPCPPYDPQKKGRVEAGVKYVKKNFFPLRIFKDLVDANQQVKQWVLEIAGNRTHGSTKRKPITMFEETEKLLLKPLPSAPPELCIWDKLTVYRDCHIRFDKCQYSAPHALINELLWLKASETTVRIYHEHNMIAIHPRLLAPGDKSTLNEHLPPKARKFLLQDANWCIEQAKTIGQSASQVIEKLINNKIVDRLRAAQGIIQLQQTYGKLRLEEACKRALAFEAIEYNVIKSILAKGLDYSGLSEVAAFEQLAEVYSGQSKFCRDAHELTH